METNLIRNLGIESPALFDSSILQKKRITQSLNRSESEYGLDRASKAKENVLTARQIFQLKERQERFLKHATLGADWLHKHIGGIGFCTLVTDVTGATLEVRASTQFEREFMDCGLRVGACWSEQEQGTCGIGTAIFDEKPISVYQDEHFLICNQGISCGSVPIFGTNNEILGVLNATATSARADRQSLTLAYNLASQAATRVEHEFFSEVHASDWIIWLSNPSEGWSLGHGTLIAFDESGLILGMGKTLKRQLTVDLDHQNLHIEDILNVTVGKLIDYAYTYPGSPITISNGSASNSIQAILRAPQKKNKVSRKTEEKRSGFDNLAASDPQVLNCIDRLKRIANHKIPILLLGETGTGKECFAKAIHDYSDRKNKPFVAINCAGIPESLIESELFGYKEGAFTGAKAKGSLGKIVQANGGTLFLDEIGDMPFSLQTRLLRVLAEGEVLALGATAPEFVDIAVICATHRDLTQMVKENTFREDLYYRINSATFTLPPLRERRDISKVMQKVLDEETQKSGRSTVLSEEVLNLLCQHTWPGNIRELRNVLSFCIAVCFNGVVSLEHLPDSFFNSTSVKKVFRKKDGNNSISKNSESCERNELISAYRRTNWSASAACKLLSMPRSTFYRKVKQYNIVSPNFTDSVTFK
ncbi:MAG: sigma-54-dependent Fis family transcriptional regulator [Methylophilus sp.]|jgi:transcriptional regulator of acetoin/glycerol metabolism